MYHTRRQIMRIEHVAIWTGDLERLKKFYTKYFNCIAGEKYHNKLNDSKMQYEGITHIAIAVGSKENVVEITEKLRSNEYTIVSEPQTTGDGYFESCVLDSDGNRVEITF